MKNEKIVPVKGITLISLVITIVVLIILASVAIYLGLSNNGIFNRAKEANEATNKQTATEIINLKITNCQINKYAEKQEMPTLQELADVLYEDNEIQYVALETKVGNKEKVTVGEKTSIFTKLNQYPYEFEINSFLQLASIDGVKIVTDKIQENTTPNSQNTTSGTEHFIGEYHFNGKPIYEKTIYIESLPNQNRISYNINVENIDEIWFNLSKSYMRGKSGIKETLPISWHIDDTRGKGVYVFAAQDQITGKYSTVTIGCSQANFSDYYAYVTIRFTKTTDKGNGNTIQPTPAREYV